MHSQTNISGIVRTPFFLFLFIVLLIASPLCGASDSDFKIYNKKSPYTRAVLFDIYQEKYPSAIGHLISQRFRHKQGKARYQGELLLAHTYVTFRMHEEAEKILNALPKNMPTDETRNKNVLWMDIARARFRTGDIKAAQKSLYKLDNNITNKLSREREVIQAQILMRQNKFKQAIEVLENTRGSSEWAAYGRYNLGVMLVRLGQDERGIKKLETVANMDPDTVEMKALKDKANYTLGYIYLRNKNPDKAKDYLHSIRLDSPLSNKALMNLGLVYAELEKHKQSLAVWRERSKRNPSDSTVLESRLAVPFAYAELGGFEQAIKSYNSAIGIFRSESKRIDSVIRSVKKGHTTNAILKNMTKNEPQSPDKPDLLLITKDTQYLLRLYESNEFQEVINNYKDLYVLKDKLKKWTSAIYKIENMSKTFKKVYVDKIAKQQSRLATATEQLKQQITKMATAELKGRKRKLNTYIKQAQFATAQIYDKGRSSDMR
jgi:tetratricopeptide (TPR) repeat protein